MANSLRTLRDWAETYDSSRTQDVIELDDSAVLADFYMAQHGAPRTQCNFAVWLSYARGISPDLTRAVDILITGERKFDLVTNQQLYSTYVSPNPAGTNDASAQLKLS